VFQASSGLSKDEIEKMKREAEANADADRKAKEEAEKVNQADTMIFQTEKQLSEYGDKLPADKKSEIEGALTELKAAHQSRNISDIESALTKINAAWQAASQDMYNATQGAGAEANPGAGNAKTSSDSEVTDVDFEEVKDK
jgi:molecular chaperone DnaK